MTTDGDIKHFGWVDYLLFTIVIVITASIGMYSALKGAKSSPSSYLTGNKQLGIFPIAMSLAAGMLSATPLLATPTDVYLTGTMHWWMVVPAFLVIPVINCLYLPVFHELQVVSANQYLEMRFNHIIRRFASIIYIIEHSLYLAIVVYGPSLALNQMTGVDVYVWVCITFVVCTLYTSLGGIKAVVWTDTLQIFLVLGSIFTVLIKGILDAGGIEMVWQRNLDTSRIEFFNIEFDPTTRQTVWSTVIGGLFFWTAVQAVQQTAVQRFNAMSTLRSAYIAFIANTFAVASIISLCCLLGLVIFARYHDCDPISAKAIEKADQIVPYFVMDIVGNLPGLPGLFVAGVFSGALSALSSGLNSVALVVLEDFIRPFRPNLSEKHAVRITKFVALALGCLCFALVFLVANVQTILDATLSLSGAYGGVILGVFTLGMFIPFANTIGAGVSMVVSFVLMIWLGIASQAAKSHGYVHNQIKSFSTENCPITNSTFGMTEQVQSEETHTEEIFVLLRVSYLWYTVMGFIIVLILGMLVSLISGRQDSTQLNPKLVCRFLRHRVGSNRMKNGIHQQEAEPLQLECLSDQPQIKSYSPTKET